MLSPAKFDHFKGAAVDSTAAEVEQWTARIADLAIDRKLEDLNIALTALWEEGRPLEGGDALPSPQSRREALLAYWDSRTETVWGLRVREAVAGFIRGEVQYSDHPFTEAEMVRFNEGRSASSQFPWPRKVNEDNLDVPFAIPVG